VKKGGKEKKHPKEGKRENKIVRLWPHARSSFSNTARSDLRRKGREKRFSGGKKKRRGGIQEGAIIAYLPAVFVQKKEKEKEKHLTRKRKKGENEKMRSSACHIPPLPLSRRKQDGKGERKKHRKKKKKGGKRNTVTFIWTDLAREKEKKKKKFLKEKEERVTMLSLDNTYSVDEQKEWEKGRNQRREGGIGGKKNGEILYAAPSVMESVAMTLPKRGWGGMKKKTRRKRGKGKKRARGTRSAGFSQKKRKKV